MSANPLTSVLAIIPARGGSKRLPRKNVALVAGVPLIAHSVRHAIGARRVDATVVSTDDPEIAAIAAAEGAEVVDRPADLSSDGATSESALLHVLDSRRALGHEDPNLVVFLQCTSPIRRSADIDRAVEQLEEEGADSLMSACENTRFIWAVGTEGPRSLNYDYRNRRRDQELEPQFQENGSIYVVRPALLRATRNRLGGKIAIYAMDVWSSFQVDSPEDLELCDWILRGRIRREGD
jgi:N-acylneuraminate cytidylyltransferase